MTAEELIDASYQRLAENVPGRVVLEELILAAQAAERERLRPWLRHSEECALWDDDPADSDDCTCDLAKAMEGE